LWRGEEVDLASRDFQMVGAHLRFPARPDIPVYISASGPKTLELAGRIADGAILLVGLFPEALRWAISHVARGAEAVGRPRPHVAVFAYGAVDEDEDAALGCARSIAAWFPQTAPHICDLAGLPREVADRVRASYQGGEFQEAAAAASELPDEYVRKVALAGNRERSAGQIRAALEAGADSVHVFPLGNRRMTTVRAFADAWSAATVGQPASRETASTGGISDIEQEIS
jgi:5,10-methylenetetrahydromethanopterin reductase